jgi:hypothetical protein
LIGFCRNYFHNTVNHGVGSPYKFAAEVAYPAQAEIQDRSTKLKSRELGCLERSSDSVKHGWSSLSKRHQPFLIVGYGNYLGTTAAMHQTRQELPERS